MRRKLRTIAQDMIFVLFLFAFSIIYFYKIITGDTILIHGDFRYAIDIQHHIIYNLRFSYIHAPKLPILFIIYIISLVLGNVITQNISMSIILFIAAVFIYLANKYFITRVYISIDNLQLFIIRLAAFTGALLFMFNPWTINRIHHHYWLVLSLASSYLLLARIDKLIHYKTSILDVLVISMLVMFVATQIHGLILYLGIMLALYITLYTVIESRTFLRKVLSRKILVIVLVVFAINLFWILPQIMTFLAGISKPGGYGIVVENVDTLSRRATLLNVLRATSRWIWGGYGWLATPRFELTISGIDIWKLISLIPAILSGLSILVAVKACATRNTRLYIAYFTFLFAFSVIFATGSYYLVVGDVYRWIFLRTPIGWVIRDPYKNVGLFIISISILNSMLVYVMLRSKSEIFRTIKAMFILFMIVSALVWGWPALTGDLNGHLKPIAYPNDLEKTINYLRANFDYRYNILWYPLEVDRVYLAYEDVPQLSTTGLNVFTITSYQLAKYIENSIRKQYVASLVRLLKVLSTKYVIARHDIIESEEKKRLSADVKLLEDALNSSKEVRIGSFTIYDLRHVYEKLRVYPYIIYGASPDLRKEFMFSNSIDFILPTNESLYFICSYCFNSPFEGYILRPQSIHYNPSEYWSLGSFFGGWLKDFNRYLEMYGLKNWQTDYGCGLVFTWARFRIPYTLHPSSTDLVEEWLFNNQIDCFTWREFTPSEQFDAKQILVCHNGILEVQLYNSTSGWKTIRSPLISVNPNHVYEFVIRIRGVSSHGVHIKMTEFNSNRELINIKYVKLVGDGTFDWKRVVFYYVPSNNSIRYVQLQIWHGHLTDKPLPNIIMIDYVKVYDITRYAKPVTLEMSFKVSRPGDYKLFVRYFENQKGGAIRVYLDGRLIAKISTVSQLNRFVWRDLSILNLEADRHVLTLENVEGFNAVNVFVLIPVEEYNKLVEDIEKLLENKTIIYLFEPESDMFRAKAKIAGNINASNGELLYLEPEGYAWQEFKIVKSGYYMIAMKLNGSARIVLNNNGFTVSSRDLGFHYLGPIYLEKGKYIIRVEALKKPLYLDVVWIYSVKSPSSRTTIEDLFKVKERPVKVARYERIDPTLWRAKVVAKKPFMLVFAEAYDPLWEARVYKDGKLIESVKSIPVYGIINGFWINETGNLTIVIRYIPQDWFELGLRISGATFTACIFYLVWDWRRGKGDRWALLLEKGARRTFSHSSYE